MECWAKNYCNKYDTSDCDVACDARALLKVLYSQSNMPKVYQIDKKLQAEQKDLDNYRFLQSYMTNVLEHVEAGQGLYIWSETTGNGKTSWACKIMNYYFRKVLFNSNLEDEGIYINVPTFLEQLRQSFNSEVEGFNKLLDGISRCKILIMDDIGTEKPTEWVRERLYTLINTRVNNGLVTIYTSNKSIPEVYATLGDRVASRIIGGSFAEIHLTGADRRLNK